MIPFLDVHTHRPWFSELAPVIRIENIHQRTTIIEDAQIVSVGLHPWFLDSKNWEKDWDRIWKAAQKHQVVAIGEIGLDRLVSIDWMLQLKVLKHQIEIANQLNLPLLIHCVRAFPETMQALKQAKVPVLFHGFSGKYSHIDSAVKAGYYISFGKALLNQASAAKQTFTQIPLEQIFLETDGEAVSIKTIYEIASDIKEIGLEDLQKQMLQNANNVFQKLGNKLVFL